MKGSFLAGRSGNASNPSRPFWGGDGEFQPNDEISQTFRYNPGADAAICSDNTLQAFANTNGIGAVEKALTHIESLGIDIAGSDFETDAFAIRSDAVFAASEAASATFDVTTSVFDSTSTQLGSSATTTDVDAGIGAVIRRRR